MPHSHSLAPFKAEHLDGVRWTEDKDAKALGPQAFAAYEKHPGYSVFCNGLFVAAAGIVVPYRGLGEGWAIAGPLVYSHKVFFHRTVSRVMDDLARDLKLVRLQAMVREQFTTSHGWVQRLGFERECVLHKFGIKGENMVVYARFYDACIR